MLDRAIQGGRPKTEFPVSQCQDISHNAVAMSLAIGKRKQNMKHRWCQRHPLLWVACRRVHLPSLPFITSTISIHNETTTIIMDILQQQQSFVKLGIPVPLPKTPQTESNRRLNSGSHSLWFEHWAPDEEREARLELTKMVRNHPHLEWNVKVERATHAKI